jgi:hypothetical protein
MTATECNNIKVFSNPKRPSIFYIAPLETITAFKSDFGGPYSRWLGYDVNQLNAKYFHTKKLLINLLAGLLSIKLLVKKEYYSNILVNLSKTFNYLESNMKLSEFERNGLHVGFDEIFLLELFKKLITTQQSLYFMNDRDPKNLDPQDVINKKKLINTINDMTLFTLNHDVNLSLYKDNIYLLGTYGRLKLYKNIKRIDLPECDLKDDPTGSLKCANQMVSQIVRQEMNTYIDISVKKPGTLELEYISSFNNLK